MITICSELSSSLFTLCLAQSLFTLLKHTMDSELGVDKMKKILMISLVFGLFAPFYAVAQEPSPEEMQKAWMAYMMPSETHKMLASWVGEWETTTKFYMGPGAPPQESNGKCTNSMIMGGRYLQGVQTGTAMGMPMEGRSVTAYDNAKQEFVSTWIDNFGTGIAVSAGTWDADKNACVMKGTMTDPMTKKDSNFDMEIKIVDENTQIMTMWSYMGDQKFKSMEMTYKRVK